MPDVHDKFDTDGAAHAGHHTLGTGALQAYPGASGAALALALANPRDWTNDGECANLNPSFDAWDGTNVSDVPHFPDGFPYNWNVFWGIGTKGVVSKARLSDAVAPSRDALGAKWSPLDPGASNQYFITEGIKVVPGETHTFGIWAKCATSFIPVAIELQLFWDPTNTNPQPFGGTAISVKPITNMTSEWQLFQGDVVIPATATYAAACFILSANTNTAQYCVIDQSFYNKSNNGLWAASGTGTWHDPGLNMTFNPEFDVWDFTNTAPQGYEFTPDATYPGTITKITSASRTGRNSILYAKGATVGPTANDEFVCTSTTKKLSGDYLVSVWVLAANSNSANPLAGIDAMIIGATNASFTTGVNKNIGNLNPINAVGANEVGVWIKYTARVTAGTGPFFRFGLRFSNNPTTTQGWYFAQFTAIKANETDSGWSQDASGFTAVAGWTIDAVLWRYIIGQNGAPSYAYLRMNFTRTGAAIAVGVTGDFGNVAFCTGMPAGLVPQFAQGFTTYTTGRLVAVAITNAPQIQLNAAAPGGNIAVGESMSISGMYML